MRLVLLNSLLAAAPLAAGAIAPSHSMGDVPDPRVQVQETPELPWTFGGDGLTLCVTSYDEKKGYAEGTVQLLADGAHSFSLKFEIDEDDLLSGSGRVQAGKRSKPIRVQELEDGSVRVVYRAKRYLMTLQEDVPPPAEAPTLESPRAELLRLRDHKFVDRRSRGIESHSVLVPVGWSAEGGAHWNPSTWFNVLPSQDIRISSPEGFCVSLAPSFIAKEVTPAAGFGTAPLREGSVDAGVPVIHFPREFEAWKRWLQRDVIPASVPGASKIQVNKAAIVPGLTAALRQEHAPIKKMLEANNGIGAGVQTEAGCAVLGFESTYSIDGRPFEELRLVVMTHSTTSGSFVGSATLWSIERAVAYRAPSGQLEAQLPLLKTIADSMRTTDEWSTMRARLQAKLTGIAFEVAVDRIKAAGRMSAIIAKSGREINAIMTASDRRNAAIRDRLNERVAHTLRGTEEYTTPGSSVVVHLPSGYERVFENSVGEYLLTNNALLDPNVDFEYEGTTWKRMKIVDH